MAIGAWLALLAFWFVGAEGNTFTDGLYHETCVQRGGHNEVIYCYNFLGLRDKQYVLRFFRKYYNFHSFPELVDTACKDKEMAANAVNAYYDTRRRDEMTKKLIEKDEFKLLKTRDCLRALIVRYEVKSNNGFI